MRYAIGIDLGGTCIKFVTVRQDGAQLGAGNVPFALETALDWAHRIRGLVQRLQTDQGRPAQAIGLSAPGLASRDGRRIAFMPGRLQGLENLDWTQFLETATPVPVLNDAHAALLGEAWLGAARGRQNVVLLTLGTGVGGAAMVDGRLLRGHLGRAGHLGHISLDPDGPLDITNTPGSLEWAIGNCTLAERCAGAFATTHDLIRAHQAGDAAATQVWQRSLKTLAAAICSLINVLDPEAVILGGGIAQAGEALFPPLQELLNRIEWRPGGHQVKLLPAQLGELAGAFGAADHAWQQAQAVNDA